MGNFPLSMHDLKISSKGFKIDSQQIFNMQILNTEYLMNIEYWIFNCLNHGNAFLLNIKLKTTIHSFLTLWDFVYLLETNICSNENVEI